MDTKSHVRDEILEAYVFKRLQAEDLDQVEDHLLICEHCQLRLEDTRQFIEATRTAAARIRMEENAGERPRSWWAALAASRPAWVVAGIAVLAFAVSLPLFHSAEPAYQELSLLTTRSANEPAVEGRSGLRLTLRLGLQGVDEQTEYHVALVDSSGKLIWKSGPVRAETREEVRVRIDQTLASGSYWVRLEGDATGQSVLREYPLQIR
jgi:hypothetical protein